MTQAVANHLGVRPKNSPGVTGRGGAQMQMSLLQAQQEAAPYSPHVAAPPRQVQAPHVVVAATPAPVLPQPQSLSQVLAGGNLSHHEAALRELGCAEPADLKDLEEADLMELGMKPIELKRLVRSAKAL